MEIIKVENLNFKYPETEDKILDNINLSIHKGEFIVLCGRTGCGKTTLLRHLKPVIAPYGDISGSIYFKDEDINKVDKRKQVQEIGFVSQNPDNQIVTDKVWHEMAFGLENLGYDSDSIRVKCAEMAGFFGIENWFYKDVFELSGGQKQILNLASVMVMNPKVLVLDEPTSQLDPVSSEEFLNTVYKINRDLGVTVILTEHRLENVFAMADRVVVMEEGKIILDDEPKRIGIFLREEKNPMFESLPAAVKIYSEVTGNSECPLTIREGRKWLDNLFNGKNLQIKSINKDKKKQFNEEILKAEDVYYKYDKKSDFVIGGMSLEIYKGEFFTLVGGNGAGKTTALNILSGIYKPLRGKITYKGQKINKYKSSELFYNNIAKLPQNPQSLFVKSSVKEDLYEVLFDIDIKEEEKKDKVKKVVSLLEIEDILDKHPYDLSGGEMQKAALAKILLLNPMLLLLDEPTKGLDGFYKEKLGKILKRLQESGVTIVMVSHDIEFASKMSDRCGMFFNGAVISSGSPESLFFDNNFYTTSAAKISRDIFSNSVLCEDVVKLCKENL